MQHPGFNTQCADGNHARWGYCNNIPSQDCQDTADIAPGTVDSDGVIGIGLEGQDCCPMGAGFTSYVVSDTPDAGNEHREQVWIQIEPSSRSSSRARSSRGSIMFSQLAWPAKVSA